MADERTERLAAIDENERLARLRMLEVEAEMVITSRRLAALNAEHRSFENGLESLAAEREVVEGGGL